jgi:hypothetical protein
MILSSGYWSGEKLVGSRIQEFRVSRKGPLAGAHEPRRCASALVLTLAAGSE